MGARREDGTCLRCLEEFGKRRDGRCKSCGVSADRVVKRNMRRRSRIGGKRGRNSGKVSQHGKKK